MAEHPQDALRIAQALLRACKAELVEARLSDRYGVTLLVHPPTLSRDMTIACDSTLAERRPARTVMTFAVLKSLEADHVRMEDVPEVVMREVMEAFGPAFFMHEPTAAAVPPLDVNEQDCARCGPNVATTWDADNVGRCQMCGGRSFDAGRETTLRRRAERGWMRPRGAR